MKRDTRLVNAGRDPQKFGGAVNVPVFRSSTVLSPSLDDWNGKKARQKQGEPGFYYGRSGTPSSAALVEAVAELEGGHAAAVFPSGLAACAAAIVSVVSAGDHVLMVDSVYGPVRKLADGLLKRMGVLVEYYDPHIGGGIEALLRPDTSLVYLESPGSHSMDIQDIPAICAVASRLGARTVLDNTWSALTFNAPFSLGADISVHAATKYITGHSDVVMGLAIANESAWPAVRATALDLGQTASPDDCFLALRGLRTLGVRMRQHDASGRRVAEWLQEQPEVAAVLHPALPSHPGHVLWQRDFSGACGLFSFRFTEANAASAGVFLNNLHHFGIGASWGGFESLALPCGGTRLAGGNSLSHMVRLHIGLEDPEDLIADLHQAFSAMRRG